MGVVSSAALYLGSSLTMVGGAPEPSPDAASPTPIAAAAATAVPAGWMADHGMVPTIVALPPAARPRSLRSVGDLIADEARREAVAAARADASAPGRRSDDDAADLNAAVIAAHDERIGYLRQQIAAVAADGRAAAQIGFLRARLRRAEAARRVAAIRSGIEVAAGGLPDPSVMLAAVTPKSPPHARRPAAHDGAGEPPRSLAGRRVAARAMARPVAATARHAAVLAAAERVAPASSDHAAGDASRNVRHLLATARRALEAHGQDGDLIAADRPVRLAGLIQWDGSDRWSLADCQARTA